MDEKNLTFLLLFFKNQHHLVEVGSSIDHIAETGKFRRFNKNPLVILVNINSISVSRIGPGGDEAKSRFTSGIASDLHL